MAVSAERVLTQSATEPAPAYTKTARGLHWIAAILILSMANS